MTAAPESKRGTCETTRLLPHVLTVVSPPSEKPLPIQFQSAPVFIHAQQGSEQIRNLDYNRSILWHVCLPILFLEFSLWFATSTLTGSVFIYLRKHLGIASVRATELNYALQTLTNLAPIVGGYLADQHLGRFNTILLACILFTCGMVLCTIASHPSVASMELLMLGLYGGVAIAQGGTGPCIVVLGADQFNMAIPAQRRQKESFFHWFYWAINIGGFVSFVFLANVAVNGLGPFIRPEMGFFGAFGLATLVFAVGSLVFYIHRANYQCMPPPKSSVLTQFFAVLRVACWQSSRGMLVMSGGLAFVPGIVLTTVSYFVNDELWHLALALTGAGCVLYGLITLVVGCQSTQWVQLASTTNGGVYSTVQVGGVAQVMRLMPYMSMIVIFWATYSQMETNFLLQGCQMDLRIGSTTAATGSQPSQQPTMISSATLSMLDSGVILLCIPLFDKLLYPWLISKGIYPTTLRKIGCGLFFSLAAMVSAAWIEIARKQRPSIPGISSNCVDPGSSSGTQRSLPMAQMNVWWHAPQYVLIGISEILKSITSYDLFYSEVPAETRSVCQSLNLLTTTLGYIVGGALNSIFSFWITSDLNDGKLENIFFIMAALLAISLGTFVYVSQSFEYHRTAADDNADHAQTRPPQDKSLS